MAIFVQDTLHMAERGSYYEGSVKIDGDFLVPPHTEFWKDIVVSGNIYLCPESHVKGNVTCKGGVICRGCVIEGDLIAEDGELRICDGASVHRIISTGDVYLRKDVISSEVRGNNILVMGKIQCGKLMGKNTRVVSGEY